MKTPRTDLLEAQNAHLYPNWLAKSVYAPFARQLEKELQVAKTLAESNGKLAHDNAIVAMRYKDELAALRLQLAKQITPS